MASLELFESALKDVVQAKRLSASKMGKLTDIALKSMENDTQLVSILYRTHKSLPTAAKVSSLYAFDALARAARSQVTKHGLTGDINSEKGNCATFLLKIEGVLDGLFQDMITAGVPETKEKSKKILDIWAKANTFPSAVLVGLTNVVKEAEKERDEVKQVADPRSNTDTNAPPPPPPQAPALASPPVPSVDPVHSTLLALLTQAAAATPPNNGQTTPNTGATLPQLDTSQLALLQQLTKTAKLSNGSPPHPIAPPIPSAPTTFHDTTGGPSSSREDHGRRFDRNISPARTRGEFYDDRPTLRGGFRGGFRGHDRDDGRGRWDHRDRFRDGRERSPPYRARRSRSRSPPSRYGGRRDVKPYSPPRRPSIMQSTVNDRSNSAPDAPEMEKDEFGRDIRPPSQKDDSVSSESAQTQPPPPPPPPEPIAASEDPRPAAPKSSQLTSSPSGTWNSSPQVPDGFVSNTSPSTLLDNFDATTFDFTSSASWEALGKMWEAANGFSPSQEALMQFVFAKGMGGPVIPPSQTSIEQGWSEQGWAGPNSNGGGGQPWAGSTGMGGTSSFGYGVTRDTREQWGHNQETNSVGLGENLGAASSGSMPPPADNGVNTTSQEVSMSGRVGAGGRMQRVGDKWVFVRETPSAES